MKYPFLVFAGSNHAPIGGMLDHYDSFETLEEAKEFCTFKMNNIRNLTIDWMHVADINEGGRIVFEISNE